MSIRGVAMYKSFKWEVIRPYYSLGVGAVLGLLTWIWLPIAQIHITIYIVVGWTIQSIVMWGFYDQNLHEYEVFIPLIFFVTVVCVCFPIVGIMVLFLSIATLCYGVMFENQSFMYDNHKLPEV
jgi:hypothetical protein